MTVLADLDGWITGLGTATGLTVTADPDKVKPPCLYVGLPDFTKVTLTATTLEIPVYLVAPGAGLQARDYFLTELPDVLTALSRRVATPEVLTIGKVDYHAYRITTPLHITA